MKNLPKSWTTPDLSPIPYIAAIILGYLVYQLFMPIRMGDTDMWYHLNGGRFFWENLSVPDTGFFSFINQSKEWTNYFWGFQAVIYKTYEFGGYQALVILRTILVLSTIAMAFILLKKDTVKSNALLLFILFSVFLIIFDGRAYQLRPHLFSYFFILLLFYILKLKPKLAPALPVLTVIWGNIHGIEWPVAALVCGAYALPVIINKVQKNPDIVPNTAIYLASIFLCPLALLLNPYGWEIYLAPFNVDADTSLYIGELIPIGIKALTTLQFNGLKIPLHTALTIMFGMTVFFLIRGLFQEKLKSPEIIIYAGGLILLFKGSRFIWEWLVLSIPLIAASLKNPAILSQLTINRAGKRQLAFIFLLLLTTTTLIDKTKHFGKYPLDDRGLPTGLKEFISKTGIKGHVLSPATIAGYVEWATYPAFLTFIDMQFPPSTDMDVFQLTRAYESEYGLKKFIETHDVDLILIPAHHKNAGKNMKKLDLYAPVFVDDALVLYVKRSAFPEIVKAYEMTHVNPHELNKIPKENRQTYIDELLRLIDITPGLSNIQQALALNYHEDKNYETALKHAIAHTELSPYNPNAYYILARVYRHLDRYEDALINFQSSLKYANKASKTKVYLSMGATYYLKQDFSSAYKYFKASMNPYAYMHEPDLMYMYALSSTIVGDLDNADKYLDMILYSTEQEKFEDIYTQSVELKQKLENGDFDAPGFFTWALESIMPEK